MKFDRYLKEAESSGVQMEHAIVNIWNGDSIPTFVEDPRITEDGVKNITASIKGKVSGKAQVFGASTMDVTEKWKRFFPGGKVSRGTMTPKTDIVIGKSNISLKTGKSAQLMSGQKYETIATFMNIAEKLGSNQQISNDIASKLEQILFKGVIESGETVKVAKLKDNLLQKAEKGRKEANKILGNFFNKNPQFKIEFAREAMSGRLKFGPQSPASADYFLNVSWDGKKVNFHSINDESYVASIGNKMKPVVAFKSSRPPWGSGEREWATVLRLRVDKLTEELKQYDGQILTEGILSKIKEKFMSWIKDFFGKIKNFITKSFSNLLEFLGLTPEVNVNYIINL